MENKTETPIEKLKNRWTLARTFHENSKYFSSLIFQQTKSIRDFSRNIDMVYESSQTFQSYPNVEKISLSKIRFSFWPGSFWSLLSRRRSHRVTKGHEIEFTKIAKIMKASAGITTSMAVPNSNNLTQFFRSYPSAGAQYPLELYALRFEQNVGSVFHFEPKNDCLSIIARDISREGLTVHSGFQDDVIKAPVYFIIAARMARTLKKYDERGYRFVLLEAGHLAQNILLSSEKLGLGACPLGRFFDDEFKNFLQINHQEELLYVVALCKK